LRCGRQLQTKVATMPREIPVLGQASGCCSLISTPLMSSLIRRPRPHAVTRLSEPFFTAFTQEQHRLCQNPRGLGELWNPGESGPTNSARRVWNVHRGSTDSTNSTIFGGMCQEKPNGPTTNMCPSDMAVAKDQGLLQTAAETRSRYLFPRDDLPPLTELLSLSPSLPNN